MQHECQQRQSPATVHASCVNSTVMLKRISRRIREFWASAALLSAEMLVILFLFALAFAIFIYLIRNVFVLEKNSLDNKVFHYLDSHVTPQNNWVMEFFTFLGTHTFLIPANLALIAWFLFVKKHRWYSIKIPAVALSSLALMFGLKHLFGRQRPTDPLLQEAAGLSFPSGHALFSVTFYGLLIYMIYKSTYPRPLKLTLASLLLLLIIIIGLSRIYLRVHYATDVIAGFCVGFLWLVFAIAVLNRLEDFSRRKIHPERQQMIN